MFMELFQTWSPLCLLVYVYDSVPSVFYPFIKAIKASNSLGFGLRWRKTHDFCKKDGLKRYKIQKDFVYLHPTRIAQKGERVITYWKKGRLRTLSSVSKSRKFAHHLEDTQQGRPLWVYCTLSVLTRQSQYISAWAIELLILGEGNARAWTRDRQSRAPTSFRIMYY